MSHKNLPFIQKTLVLAISAILANSVTSNAYSDVPVNTTIIMDGNTGTNTGSESSNHTIAGNSNIFIIDGGSSNLTDKSVEHTGLHGNVIPSPSNSANDPHGNLFFSLYSQKIY